MQVYLSFNEESTVFIEVKCILVYIVISNQNRNVLVYQQRRIPMRNIRVKNVTCVFSSKQLLTIQQSSKLNGIANMNRKKHKAMPPFINGNMLLSGFAVDQKTISCWTQGKRSLVFLQFFKSLPTICARPERTFKLCPSRTRK